MSFRVIFRLTDETFSHELCDKHIEMIWKCYHAIAIPLLLLKELFGVKWLDQGHETSVA